MIMRKKLVTLSALLCLAISAAACGNDSDLSTLSESSKTPSQASSQVPSSQSPSSGGGDNTSGSSEKPAIIQTVFSITPSALEGNFDTFYITDSNTQDTILDLLSTIQPVDPVQNPITGGYFFNLSISYEGITEKYQLSNHDNTPNGHYRIYKDGDSQPYNVDPALWDIIAESFPTFAR